MKIISFFAASALAIASTTASAGDVSNVGTTDDVIIVVPEMDSPGSMGSLGSLGGGGTAAIGLVAVALLAALAADDSSSGTGSGTASDDNDSD